MSPPVTPWLTPPALADPAGEGAESAKVRRGTLRAVAERVEVAEVRTARVARVAARGPYMMELVLVVWYRGWIV